MYFRINLHNDDDIRNIAKLQKMYQLNLPEYQIKVKKQNNKLFVFDRQRKRFVTLTPEEWVRQNFISFLIDDLNYPSALLAVECQVEVQSMKKRCDAILYNNEAKPILIIEFKAPDILITQSTFDQVAIYNSKLAVDYFIISNGFEHYFCKVDIKNARYEIASNIPSYQEFILLINSPSKAGNANT